MIGITINNDDVHDLFVTVTDINAGGAVPMNHQRINHNAMPVPIQVQEDQNGKGNIQWTAVDATDPIDPNPNSKTKPATPGAGEPVNVDLF